MQTLKKGQSPVAPALLLFTPMHGRLSAYGPITIHSFPGTGHRPGICMDIGGGLDIILPTGAIRALDQDIRSAAEGLLQAKDIPGFIQAAHHSPAMRSPGEVPERLAGEQVQAPIPEGVLPEVRAAGAQEDPEDTAAEAAAALRAHRLEDTAAEAAAVQRVRADPARLHN